MHHVAIGGVHGLEPVHVAPLIAGSEPDIGRDEGHAVRPQIHVVQDVAHHAVILLRALPVARVDRTTALADAILAVVALKLDPKSVAQAVAQGADAAETRLVELEFRAAQPGARGPLQVLVLLEIVERPGADIQAADRLGHRIARQTQDSSGRQGGSKPHETVTSKIPRRRLVRRSEHSK